MKDSQSVHEGKLIGEYNAAGQPIMEYVYAENYPVLALHGNSAERRLAVRLW